MHLAILHLSDIHIDKANNQWIISKAKSIVDAVWNDFIEADKIVIVVSGDIANTGSQEDYAYANQFFHLLLRSFAERNMKGRDLENKIILVPGNHDCNLVKANSVRTILLSSITSGKVKPIDQTIYDTVSSVQQEYSDFVSLWMGKDFRLQVNNDIPITVGEKTVLFRLYNTAWMSVAHDAEGTLAVPMHMIAPNSLDADLSISVFHHHYEWLTVNYDNNRSLFRQHVMQTSNIALYGHEHKSESSHMKDNFDNTAVNEFEGGALFGKRSDNTHTSSFNGFVIDLDTYECVVRNYVYAKGLYTVKRETTVSLTKERKTDEFKHDADSIKSLKKMSIPIHNSENEKMTLDEFFVYPDLERMNARQLRVDEDFIDSETLLNDGSCSLSMLEGDDQCGKTSLLNMYYLRSVERYYYPLMVKGRDIGNGKIDRFLGKAFAEQYDKQQWERYVQHDVAKKILFIDNFDECQLNEQGKRELIDRLSERFHKLIITTKENESVSSSYFLMQRKDTLMARIKPLGHVKRNELVKKFYMRYDVNASKMQQQEMLNKVKAGFNLVESFLGKEYIPSYPIYILSILLSNTKLQVGNSFEQTSYAYCYESLITCALMTCVEKEKIDKYQNFLRHLAYYIYNRNGKSISEDEFMEFHREYADKFIAPGYKEVKKTLLDCNLLRCSDDYYYKFTYSYIYYFLTAKYMADAIHTPKGQSDIMNLCENIHDDQKSNILIFIAHHIQDPQFIEATQLALMSSLDKVQPVTLDRNDNFYKLLNNLCESLKKEIVDSREEIDPEKERETMLRKQDEHEKMMPRKKINPNEIPVEIQAMNKSLRSIEVVGQIVKNRIGSIEKRIITDLIKDIYSASFRSICYFGKLIESDKEQVINDVISNKKEGTSDETIKKKLDTFFELTSLNYCLFAFSKVINAVGSKELRPYFVQVANEMNTPAAKLVTFSVNSCFSKLAIRDLEDLVEELNDNPVAMSIIRARVRSYLYNNYVHFNVRQKIIDTVNLSHKDTEIMVNRSKRNKR